MTGSHRNKPLDFSSLPQTGHQDSPFMPPDEANPFPGQLAPPFNTVKEEGCGRGNPSEGRLPDRLREDIGNYGKGGYYGSTYNQNLYNRERDRGWDRMGQPDHYRQLGDRRWSDDPLTWEKERYSRTGYRTLRDRAYTANHQGKGPRSWRRSDDRVLEDINDRLYDDPFLNATDVQVDVLDGEVFLTGSVDSRQSKRRAEDIAESVSGVRHLENRLRVKNELPTDHQLGI